MVRFARHMAVFTACGWGCEQIADTVELVVSELVTNAVDAAIAAGLKDGPYPWEVTSGHRIDLTMRLHEKGVDILVEDRLPGLPRFRSNASAAEATRPEATLAQLEEHGRGLLLIATLATQWGFTPQPGGGKVVWCTIATSPAAPATTAVTEERVALKPPQPRAMLPQRQRKQPPGGGRSTYTPPLSPEGMVLVLEGLARL
ncbi:MULTISPECIES: ATP-binding protein [Nocardiopsis]|uniref:ATP-binding protein n=1 Tax=Nocardiopsis TaxID=2013 RepID=UPI001478FF45|nr:MULTISPECIES: ATP-binding protein [Nocardiopsis]